MSKGKKLFQKIMIALCFCFLAMGLLPAAKVEAAGAAPSCAKTQTVYFFPADMTGYGFNNKYIYIKNMYASSKVKDVTSSNKKVDAAFAYKKDSMKLKAVEVKYKNSVSNGEKSKIRFTVVQNGKSYKLSCVVTFKKMPTVIKSLKIKNKEYAIKDKYQPSLKASGSLYFDHTSGNIKIEVQMSSGYVLDAIEIFGFDKDHKPVEKTIKNGSSIKLEDLVSMHIYYYPKEKPANYSKPLVWKNQWTKSPRHEYFYLRNPNW